MMFLSYNSRGFSEQKQDFCKTLISQEIIGNREAIFCNQENFLLRNSSYKITRTFPNHHCFINPAIKSNHDKGRARNGMFIAVPNSLINHVNDVSPGHWRIQAVKISLPSSTILLINSYFPTDPKTNNFNEDDLQETLQVITNVIDKNHFNSVLLLGDINCDFSRNTRFVQAVQTYLQEYSLIKSWEKFEVDFTHFQETNEITHVSVIDHFFWNCTIDSQISEAGVIHHCENLSDHSPIYCLLETDMVPVDDVPQDNPVSSKPSWKKATTEQKEKFPAVLNEKLSSFTMPEDILNCKDVKCRDTNHCDKADEFIGKVLRCVEDAAAESLPIPSPPKTLHSKSKHVPGWKTLVKPFRDSAFFWHQVWTSAGRPINTTLHKIMKRTRNVYHFQYRKCRKAEELIKKNKLLDACINGNGDIFLEIKKLRKAKPVAATSMDGVTDNIPDHFRGIFKELYNSANDKEELVGVLTEVEDRINESSLDDVQLVTPEIVKQASKKLQDSKSDPQLNFSSDCIRNGTNELFEKLSAALQCFLIHGHVTHFLLLATLVPLIKDKLGSLNSSTNYRTIAISSLILKLLDWVILILFGAKLGIDDLQFAYQPGVSANMCTWTVIETVSYFLRNGGNVYCCMMDMSKAFDLVKHSILFKKFLKAGLSAVFIRLLIFIYINQFANIRWNNQLSSSFSMTNGVRQGAILSGFAYCFYVNQLFNILKKKKSGCWIRGSFFGIQGYSDDSLLLAPSLDSLQEMIQTCESYASSHNLRFSTDPNPKKCKTKCIAFLLKDRPLPPMYLCGNPLPWVSSGKHLGITLSNKIDGMKTDILIKRAEFINKNNEILQEFYFSHPKTKIKINGIYNSHLTGSCLWDLFCREAVMMENTWNVAMRLMLDIPRESHRYLIEPLSNVTHIKTILVKRFLTFLEQIRKSEKSSSKFLLETILHDARSTTGANLRNILLNTDKSDVSELVPDDAFKVKYHIIKSEEQWRLPFIADIIEAKNDQLSIPNISDSDLDEMLTVLCTS